MATLDTYLQNSGPWFSVSVITPPVEIDCIVLYTIGETECYVRAPVYWDGTRWVDEWGNILTVTHYMILE